MPDQALPQLLLELDAKLLAGGPLSDDERALLRRVHADLERVLQQQPSRPVPHGLRDDLEAAVGRLASEHPGLAELLGRVSDALSEFGV